MLDTFVTIHIYNIFLLQDIVDTHPGLTFLQEAPEFHSRYVNTVSIGKD